MDISILNRRRRWVAREGGWTLIELMVVLALILILTSLALAQTAPPPGFTQFQYQNIGGVSPPMGLRTAAMLTRARTGTFSPIASAAVSSFARSRPVTAPT